MIKDGGLLGSVFWPVVLPPGVGRTVVAILSALYWGSSLMLWTRGQTPAKRFLLMTVVTEDGEPAGFFRMAFRETIGKIISMTVLGLGILSIGIDPEKRGWHDKIFGTWVVHDEEP
ncbi:MAG: RDD family protein [Gemmatimonadetes bacterium]|nr:RDD family protein [Gemmatimonadota bacterium]